MNATDAGRYGARIETDQAFLVTFALVVGLSTVVVTVRETWLDLEQSFGVATWLVVAGMALAVAWVRIARAGRIAAGAESWWGWTALVALVGFGLGEQIFTIDNGWTLLVGATLLAWAVADLWARLRESAPLGNSVPA